MAKHKEEKTNVMRVLDQKKIPYTAHTYDPESGIDGVSVARSLGQDPASVFKTLVARGASGGFHLQLGQHLVAAEIVLAFVLLYGAGLLGNTLRTLTAVASPNSSPSSCTGCASDAASSMPGPFA